MNKRTEWLEATCPECGRKYKYTQEYKPSTCSDFQCVRQHLHPELKRNGEQYKTASRRKG